MKKVTEEWLKAAKDDLDVIGKIIDDAHLSHIVAFHAQQCVEKVFKAILEEHDIETPKVHNLITLLGKVESFLRRDVDLGMLQTLDSLYIEARYPGELGLLPNGKPTIEEAGEFFGFAQNIYNSIKDFLVREAKKETCIDG